MTARVDVVIMAHKRRAAYIPELLAKLDRPAEVVWDSGNNDRWDTGRRAWLEADRTASHALVLQDDAVICRDLVAGIEQALPHIPDDSPMCLYCGRVRPYRQMIQGLVNAAGPATSWLTMGQCHWGVGIVVPTRHIPDMIAWGDRRSEIPNYDRRLSRWFQQHALTVYYPWPSLVDHRNSPSLVPGRGSAGRRAHRFIGADASALTDWDPAGTAVSVPSASAQQPQQIDHRRWRVVGHAAHASIATETGRARQLHFKGAILSGVPAVEVEHLLSVGLIVPEPDPPTAVELQPHNAVIRAAATEV